MPRAVTAHRLEIASQQANRPVSPAHLAIAATAGNPSPWVPYKWTRLLNRKLMELAKAREAFARTGKVVGTHFLIIEAPVRHGKSELGSVWFPSWWLGTFPDDRVILTGNNAELAEGFSRRVRDLLRDRGQELFGSSIRVSQESSSVYRWDLAAPHMGGLIAVGVGSPPTGRGAHCLSGETLVTTEEGEISIAGLIALPVQPRVLSFNHDTNQTEWAPIEAHRSLRGDEIVEVITAAGRIIRCTPEHLFFSNGLYVQAGSLSPGDSLVSGAGEDALPSVRDTEVGRDAVSVVRRLRSPGHRVYDLQVAGNRNFFAGEILVHNCLIIDDPIKSDLQAYSAAWRESLWRWWLFSIRSRLEPGGVCVIIMSRWHADDLVGRLLKRQKEADRAEQLRAMEKPDLTEDDLALEAKDKTIEDVIDRWEVLHLPALSEGAEDPLGREEGAALCPERYDRDALLRLRDGPLGVGPVAFSALYQNNPVSATGTIFKVEKLNIIPALPVDTDIRWIRRWDLAATEKKMKGDPDWTAGVLMGRTKAGYIIIADARRDRRDSGPVEAPNTVESFMRSTAIEDQARLNRRIKIKAPQDPGSAGKVLIAHYKATVMAGFDFTGELESGDKLARAMPFANQVEAGNVSLVEGVWNYDFIEELRAFNLGAHDDYVDAASNAYLDLAGLSRGKVRVLV